MKIAIAIVIALSAGCAIDPTDTGGEESEIGKGDDGPPDPPEPPPPPPSCASLPSCTNTAWVVPYVTTLQQQLGCNTTRRFTTGIPGGFMGGLGSFCPDTPYVRAMLHNHYRGWTRPYCNDCIHIPAGKLWVFWIEYLGPGCPGGCEPAPPPGGF
jgi:hypothetical protein